MADTTSPPPSYNAIYQEISPAKLWSRRIFSGITILMVLLAMLFCLIKGKGDGTFYLLFVNILISCVILVFLLWWYRTGDLVEGKFWFIVLVASVIIFQCITTDIFVFNHTNPGDEVTTIHSITLQTANLTTKKPPLLHAATQSMIHSSDVNPPIG
ncbi:uncharacterized protein [Diadema setosum]|uniref:uncharacterized protein n=1 Tax=Diadema antillarum TaxID=105358 RepID=UPI003A88DAB4